MSIYFKGDDNKLERIQTMSFLEKGKYVVTTFNNKIYIIDVDELIHES